LIKTKSKPTFVTQKQDKKRKEKQEVIIRIGSKEGNYRERRLAGIALLIIMTNHLYSVTYINTEAKEAVPTQSKPQDLRRH
jgi:hypothetical protein